MADAADARPVAALSKSGRKKRMKAERGGFSLPTGRPPVGKTWDPELLVWVDQQGNQLTVEEQKAESKSASKRKKEQKKNEQKKLRRALIPPREIGLLAENGISLPFARKALPRPSRCSHRSIRSPGGSENGRRHFPAIFLRIASPPQQGARILSGCEFNR